MIGSGSSRKNCLHAVVTVSICFDSGISLNYKKERERKLTTNLGERRKRRKVHLRALINILN